MSTDTCIKPKLLSLMPFKAIEAEYLNDFKTQFIIDVGLDFQLNVAHPLRPDIGAKSFKS
jgi:hypothetical protein